MKVWVTQDGRRIPIDKLTDAHLINILRMLKRRAIEVLALYQSLVDRGEIDWRKHTHKQFRDLEIEAQKRGLEWEDGRVPMQWLPLGRNTWLRSIWRSILLFVRES